VKFDQAVTLAQNHAQGAGQSLLQPGVRRAQPPRPLALDPLTGALGAALSGAVGGEGRGLRLIRSSAVC
jgi:hypothetical protein